MSFHYKEPEESRHPPVNGTFADETARLAATGFVAGYDFEATDIGGIAWQQDNDTFWVLKSISPVTWTQLGGMAPPAPHASTHELGGSDEVLHQNLNGAGTNTHAQIDTHIDRTTVLTGFGTPVGVETGYIGQTYRDLTNDIFYRCTADGTTDWQIV